MRDRFSKPGRARSFKIAPLIELHQVDAGAERERPVQVASTSELTDNEVSVLCDIEKVAPAGHRIALRLLSPYLENHLRALERSEQAFRHLGVMPQNLLSSDQRPLTLDDALTILNVALGLFVTLDPDCHLSRSLFNWWDAYRHSHRR